MRLLHHHLHGWTSTGKEIQNLLLHLDGEFLPSKETQDLTMKSPMVGMSRCQCHIASGLPLHLQTLMEMDFLISSTGIHWYHNDCSILHHSPTETESHSTQHHRIPVKPSQLRVNSRTLVLGKAKTVLIVPYTWTVRKYHVFDSMISSHSRRLVMVAQRRSAWTLLLRLALTRSNWFLMSTKT